MAAQVDERSRSLQQSEGRLKEALVAQTAARAEAEAANRAKDEFLITLSHELRTPLSRSRLGEAAREGGRRRSTATRPETISETPRPGPAHRDMLDMPHPPGKLHLELTNIDLGR